MSRQVYHRDYYWRTVERRRAAARRSRSRQRAVKWTRWLIAEVLAEL